MSDKKKIKNALISVFHKDGLKEIVELLEEQNVEIYSTGGTHRFIEQLGVNVHKVEDLTSYPSILGGRVKTLHPKVFGGILARRNDHGDVKQLKKYEIPEIDLVIVDLYPFEKTVESGAGEEEIIEKIDIGGISLIRAGAKNFTDVLTISSMTQYDKLKEILKNQEGVSDLITRKEFAAQAFNLSSHYDTLIYNYFAQDTQESFKESILNGKSLRYGENPHQKGTYFGDFDQMFDQIHGKEISYNNLLDIDAAVNLINEFNDLTFAVLKHNNACGLATRNNMKQAYLDALAGDPVSAFGGVLITNGTIDEATAEEMNQLFFEIIIAPDYEDKALEILKTKKNRIILLSKDTTLRPVSYRSILNGTIIQDRDTKTETISDMQTVTTKQPTKEELKDLEFANKLVKQTKSNAIVLAKNQQLLASGVGQTSRVDALQQAIAKATHFGFQLEGAVMASDAFFPFPDCVEIAGKENITSVIQPGGSIRDDKSIDCCNQHNMSMVVTGTRHFKH